MMIDKNEFNALEVACNEFAAMNNATNTEPEVLFHQLLKIEDAAMILCGWVTLPDGRVERKFLVE